MVMWCFSMKISKIEIKNFKSFDDVSVDLNDFNAIVGECASGKSNFIEAFKFLKDICDNGENGINLHGGPFVQNFKIESEIASCIKVTFIDDGSINLNYPISEDTSSKLHYDSVDYELCINFNKNNFEIMNEIIKFNFEIYEGEYLESNLLSKNSLILKNQNGKVTSGFENDDEFCDLEFFTPKSLINIVNNNFKQKQGLIINSPLSSVPFDWANFFREIHIHDFDPKFCKMPYGNGNPVLSEYGDNLSLILDNILTDEANKRKFINLVSILLPYVEDVDVDHMREEQRIFKLFEKYDDAPVFAPFVSDGTTNVLALISALYFSNGDILLIEEPERNIHPRLLIKLVTMMKEISSRGKQIIITTHSPEILDYCDLEDIQLISRNSNGFSTISQPKDNSDVIKFVEELGIGHVFLNNYLWFENE